MQLTVLYSTLPMYSNNDVYSLFFSNQSTIMDTFHLCQFSILCVIFFPSLSPSLKKKAKAVVTKCLICISFLGNISVPFSLFHTYSHYTQKQKTFQYAFYTNMLSVGMNLTILFLCANKRSSTEDTYTLGLLAQKQTHPYTVTTFIRFNAENTFGLMHLYASYMYTCFKVLIHCIKSLDPGMQRVCNRTSHFS